MELVRDLGGLPTPSRNPSHRPRPPAGRRRARGARAPGRARGARRIGSGGSAEPGPDPSGARRRASLGGGRRTPSVARGGRARGLRPATGPDGGTGLPPHEAGALPVPASD